MRNNWHSVSSLCVMFGHVAVLALLLVSGHRSSAESAISETVSSPDSASSPDSPSSSFSSSSRQKRAPGWGKRDGLEELDNDDSELEGDAVYTSWDNSDLTDKRAPGWGKRAPGWGKRAPGWGKRAPGWGKRAPGWGKRSLDADNVLEEEEDKEKRAPGWGKRAPGWGKRAPGWGKRAPGWGKRSPGWTKRAPGWGKRAPGWGKRAPGWGKRSGADYCQKIDKLAEIFAVKAKEAEETWIRFCGDGDYEEVNELDRK